MKLLKFILILTLISSLFLPAVAGKRPARKSMKELTDPNSPSYVPFPYPKTRAEIIADLKFYSVDMVAERGPKFVGYNLLQRIPPKLFKRHKRSAYKTKESREKILSDMFKPDTKYRIGKIVKVKNCEDRIPDDYYWLIYVVNREGEALVRMSMFASGLELDGSSMDKSDLTNASKKRKERLKRHLHVISKKEVKESFSAALGDIAADSKIVKLERLGFFGGVGGFTQPAWVITLRGGETYYYKELTDTVFKVAGILSWKKVNGYRGHLKYDTAKYHHNYVPDRTNDKFILLEPIPKKKQ